MITRKMNHRVTFFREIGGQNEDGEVIPPSRKNLYTCCEVAKTSLKDFQEGAGTKQPTRKLKGLFPSSELKTLYIRHNPERPFDSSDHVEFNGFEWDIVSVDATNHRLTWIKSALRGGHDKKVWIRFYHDLMNCRSQALKAARAAVGEGADEVEKILESIHTSLLRT